MSATTIRQATLTDAGAILELSAKIARLKIGRAHV